MTVSRARCVLVTVVVAAAVAGCGGSGDSRGATDGGAGSLEALARQELSTLAGVSSVEAPQTAVGQAEGSDPLDPDLWSLDIDVVMSERATTAQVAAAAEATHAFAAERVGSARWTAHVTVGASRPVAGEDRTTPPVVQLEVHPSVQRSATEDARAAMRIKDLAGVDGVATAAGRFEVRIVAADRLAGVVERLRDLPAWGDGGSVGTTDGRVRLADVPDRVTPAQVRAIGAVAVAHPGADVALESSGRSPEVYVNRVTVAEARTIASTLSEPRLASRNDDGFELEFTVRGADADRTVDTHGTFGVPDRG